MLFPVVIAVACRIDGTIVMPTPGAGLAQHFGYWAIFVTTPCIVLLTVYLVATYASTIQRTQDYCVGLTPTLQLRLDRLIALELRRLSLAENMVWVLVLCVFVGFCCWVLNVVNTISPVPTYGHDVFDAYGHRYGYYTAKAYDLFVAAAVWAPAAFFCLYTTFSMVSILRFIYENDIVSVNFFHPDNCGGTSRFGNINLIILCIYANSYAIIYGNYVTHHQTYFAMIAALIGCTAVAIVQSFLAVYFIHRAVAKKKRQVIEAVTAQMNALISAPTGKDAFPSDLLAYRNHLMGVRTFPYARGVLIAVSVIQAAPTVLGFLSKAHP
ncbi:MAG TPA: hypothetical protein VGU66_03570 [Candidatus Elarobacter sp.]|nr:hypothetical protein [Candidatus Elarobacter sp.]